MQMIIHFMIITGGILGEGSSREILHINHGYGPQEIMKLILLLNLYASYFELLLICSLKFRCFDFMVFTYSLPMLRSCIFLRRLQPVMQLLYKMNGVEFVLG